MLERGSCPLSFSHIMRGYPGPILNNQKWQFSPIMVQISETPRNSSRTFIADSSEDEYESLPESHPLIGLYDKPLPCFGCGMGWVMVVLGLVFPPLWYCGALLYLTNYYDYDPRERSGLAAAAIMALILTAVISIVLLVLLL